jgi:hypothetical protein
MFKKINTIKLFFLSFLGAIILAAPLIRFYNYLFPSRYGTFFDVDPLKNVYIATVFGLSLSVPLLFGFLGVFCFRNQYKKLMFFVVIPTLIVDLIWGIGGTLWDFIIPFSISLLIATIGAGLGVFIQFVYKKFKA